MIENFPPGIHLKTSPQPPLYVGQRSHLELPQTSLVMTAKLLFLKCIRNGSRKGSLVESACSTHSHRAFKGHDGDNKDNDVDTMMMMIVMMTM